MTPTFLRAGLCSVAVSLTALAPAADPPLVVRTPGGNTTVITNSGNGVGNRIVVSGTGGTTIVKNVRNGIGNQLILDPNELFIDLDDVLPADVKPLLDPRLAPPVVIAPKLPPVYDGKANPFWSQKQFSDALDCNLYWSDADKLWYRYTADDDRYRPLRVQPPAPQPAVPQPPLPPLAK